MTIKRFIFYIYENGYFSGHVMVIFFTYNALLELILQFVAALIFHIICGGFNMICERNVVIIYHTWFEEKPFAVEMFSFEEVLYIIVSVSTYECCQKKIFGSCSHNLYKVGPRLAVQNPERNTFDTIVQNNYLRHL